ncbi:uncharacterized protein VTP21DRAFT_10465 [Calcarisporiella thermophila]|uniref:uncharacterized protein n=1 Tax=Calcarisporiella thermophila TaxID=911321 RepID=UPI00374238B6
MNYMAFEHSCRRSSQGHHKSNSSLLFVFISLPLHIQAFSYNNRIFAIFFRCSFFISFASSLHFYSS